MAGGMVLSEPGNDLMRVDGSTLIAGLYVVQMTDAKGQVDTRKIKKN